MCLTRLGFGYLFSIGMGKSSTDGKTTRILEIIGAHVGFHDAGNRDSDLTHWRRLASGTNYCGAESVSELQPAAVNKRTLAYLVPSANH